MTRQQSLTQSLDRAIDILEVLAREGPCSLHKASQISGLPKSTTRRLLEALSRRNLTRRGLSDGNYRINIALQQYEDASHAGRAARLVRAASGPMVSLTETIGWPVDLHIFNQDRMQIIETTHALSPFEFGKQHIYDLELNVFAAASGIAHLSTLKDKAVEELIDKLSNHPRLSMRSFRISHRRLFEEIQRARTIGFARRLVVQTGALAFNAISTPIQAKGSGIGAIAVWWPKRFCTPESFMGTYGEDILRTAGNISKAL